MIEISISSELAAKHPRFMAECGERDQRVEVFEPTAPSGETNMAAVTETDTSSETRKTVRTAR